MTRGIFKGNFKKLALFVACATLPIYGNASDSKLDYFERKKVASKILDSQCFYTSRQNDFNVKSSLIPINEPQKLYDERCTDIFDLLKIKSIILDSDDSCQAAARAILEPFSIYGFSESFYYSEETNECISILQDLPMYNGNNFTDFKASLLKSSSEYNVNHRNLEPKPAAAQSQVYFDCRTLLDCFNCTSTLGYCQWSKDLNRCNFLNKLNTSVESTWPYLFDNCTDQESICKTNVLSESQLISSNQTYGIIAGQKYYFTIGQVMDQVGTPSTIGIPQAYMCNWTLSIDPAYKYSMSISRYRSIQNEWLMMRLLSDRSEVILTETFLGAGLGQTISFRVLYPKLIQIYARNLWQTPNSTFLISIEADAPSESSVTVFGVVSLILFVLMMTFVCICVGAVIRLCIRKRQLSQQVVQNQVRNLSQHFRANSVRPMDAAQVQQENEQRINQLIELIKEKSYDKRIDEFMQLECVICFEEFQKGVPVRQIPICHHIFHSKCIDSWFRAKNSSDFVHKCPLCNTEVTLAAVKEALKKNNTDKKSKQPGDAAFQMGLNKQARPSNMDAANHRIGLIDYDTSANNNNNHSTMMMLRGNGNEGPGENPEHMVRSISNSFSPAQRELSLITDSNHNASSQQSPPQQVRGSRRSTVVSQQPRRSEQPIANGNMPRLDDIEEIL
ncbi:hypothetical protein FGO68_gene9949 [Halteria grandinella]|uniref:RING-type domain-containing protein n=1 Tax=Halteria grandinella TaxID=5974 RepID=A0A8J8P1E7_HALGN|nr:hypothetical protein FGO68_gene9949 [Halteria grandinella]